MLGLRQEIRLLELAEEFYILSFSKHLSEKKKKTNPQKTTNVFLENSSGTQAEHLRPRQGQRPCLDTCHMAHSSGGTEARTQMTSVGSDLSQHPALSPGP